MVHRPQCVKRKLGARGSKISYPTKFPSPWGLQGVLTSAHINKLMIIAKWENHTQDTQTNKMGKLEWKKFYHTIAYNLKDKDT